jgi:hypothetical protein
MTITANHLIIFLLVLNTIGVCYLIYWLRVILTLVDSIFDMSVNIEEATKPQDTEEEFIGAN